MKVLLFGGTFDPPHYGHINNLKAALEAVQPDRVIVMPVGAPPHKQASATPGAVRLEMCRCFCAVDPRVELSDWEVRQQGKSFTVDTLEMLAGRFPGAELYFTVGSDMLLSFREWRRWQDILRTATLVVQSRLPGDRPQLEQAAQGLRQQGGRVLLCQAPALELASKQIRTGQAGAEALPPSVAQTIQKYGLYAQNP